MLKLLVTLQSFLTTPRDRSDEGATMVEYGLLVAFIAVVVGVAAATLGTAVAALFTRVGTSL
jgi:pilus assembly protein Flp/PilA